MSEFISLSCPNCGGSLKITADLDRFACSYCGQEHVVKRGEGVVSLAPVMDALGQVRSSVDKTAAELSIMRLSNELAALKFSREQVIRENPIPKLPDDARTAALIGMTFLFFSCVNLSRTGTGTTFVSLIVISLFFLSYFGLKFLGRRSKKVVLTEMLKPWDEKITAKQEELKKVEAVLTQKV